MASAQSAVDIGVGFGAAWDKSNGQGIDNLNSANALGPCTPNSGDADCQTTGSMNGFFLGINGDIMLYKHRTTRRYLNIDAATGRFCRYADGEYVEIDRRQAFDSVYAIDQ